jgi:hypothetical protein
MAHEGAVAAFGEQLRHERESRGLAIEAIYNATKVPIRYIRALEAGSFRELPGGVFRRGFVRSYLGVLGLEESSWMQRFEESCRESGVSCLFFGGKCRPCPRARAGCRTGVSVGVYAVFRR